MFYIIILEVPAEPVRVLSHHEDHDTARPVCLAEGRALLAPPCHARHARAHCGHGTQKVVQANSAIFFSYLRGLRAEKNVARA
jgi:hypothetical protein